MENEMILFISTSKPKISDPSICHIIPDDLKDLQILKDSTFNKCEIENTSAELLISDVFSQIFRLLKEKGSCIITIYQPISIMQLPNSQLIKECAKNSGFCHFESSTISFVKNGKTKNTIVLKCFKPVRKASLMIKKSITLNLNTEEVKKSFKFESPLQFHYTSAKLSELSSSYRF